MKVEVQSYQPKRYTGDPSKWPDGWYQDVDCGGVVVYKRGNEITQFQYDEIYQKKADSPSTYSCDYFQLPAGSVITITV